MQPAIAAPNVTGMLAAAGAPRIYQPYLNDGQRAVLSPLAQPLDISFNTGSTSREYELFQHIFNLNRTSGFPDHQFWGLVSSKFEHKSPISFQDFAQEAARAQAGGFDAFVINPMIGYAAVHVNVWEQGIQSGHQGLGVIHQFLAQKGLPVAVLEGEQTFALCNYVCGNRKFWEGYFSFMETMLGLLEAEKQQQTPVGSVYGGGAGYARDASAAMRIFVIERLLGCYITVASQTTGLKVASYVPQLEDFALKFGTRLSGHLHGLYQMKSSLLRQPTQADVDRTLHMWNEQRMRVLAAPHLIWQLDDPPDWVPNPHKLT